MKRLHNSYTFTRAGVLRILLQMFDLERINMSHTKKFSLKANDVN